MSDGGFRAMPFTATPKIHVEPDRSEAVPTSSWWTECKQAGFTQRAEREFLRMRRSKEHFRIGLRILQ